VHGEPQGFKGVNDNINHVVGDEALHVWGGLVTSVAKAVQHCKAVIYRPGGDEIAVICEKKMGVSDDDFCDEVIDITKGLAIKVFDAEGSNPAGELVKVPTFLR
jgi:GGDEF domain-containing protein